MVTGMLPIQVFAEDMDGFDWYDGPDAGGFVLRFGKHKGRKVNQLDSGYLEWLNQRYQRPEQIQYPSVTCFRRYYQGLEQWMQEEDRYNHGRFVVPCGRKHSGQVIAECRDKPWLRWITSRYKINTRFPLFCQAARRFLENPSQHGNIHDVGELLSASEYRDDLDLNMSEDEDDLDGFVVSDDPAEDEAEQAAEGSQDDAESAGHDSDASSHRGRRRRAPTPSEENESDSTPEEPRRRNTRRNQTSDSWSQDIDDDNFIASEDGADVSSSATFVPSDNDEMQDSYLPVPESQSIVNGTSSDEDRNSNTSALPARALRSNKRAESELESGRRSWRRLHRRSDQESAHRSGSISGTRSSPEFKEPPVRLARSTSRSLHPLSA
ncbi:hypothetical protein C8J56DRAFT_937854 [Mycena floridula]|nr:hypothetical protein C8J56DRAFT_937854 [Mycena floridula]